MTSNAASKAMLRDSINRLKKIRAKCGKQDEEMRKLEGSGDPFRDAVTIFTQTLTETKDEITDRNASAKKHGQDRQIIEQSNDIMKKLRELEAHLRKIGELVQQAETTLARANKKKKSVDKIRLLERQRDERQSAYDQCKELLEGARDLNQQRFGEGKGAMTSSQQVKLGQRTAMREQLMSINKKKRPGMNGTGGGDDEGGASAGSAGGGGGGGGSGKRLEDDPETAAQMKVIKDQERKIDAGLTNLQKGVGRLHQIALQIGSEIDVQNKMLDNTEKVVDQQTNKLASINRRLDKLVKNSNPINTFINIGCGILLLALVGYLLYEFGVIPS